jgi:hypothetical protein
MKTSRILSLESPPAKQSYIKIGPRGRVRDPGAGAPSCRIGRKLGGIPMSFLRALLVAGLGLPAIAAAAPAPVTVINGATLIHPSKSGDAVAEPGATIVIAGDRIQLAGAGITLELPQGAKVIDARGKWVIPGLVDSHVHFFQSGNLYTRPDAADFNAVVPYA